MLLPVKNYIESQPIKMYEYMAAGLPFIASDFPLWKEVVDQWRCGICVPPDDVNQTRIAIEKLFGNRRLAQSMGRNGRKAIEKKYNWQIEEKKLLLLYQGLEND